MAAARHCSPNMVLAYRLDADSKRKKVMDEKDTSNMVGSWSPIHFDNPKDMERIGNSARYTKDLDELAKDFVEDTLGITAGTPHSTNISYIIDKALAWSPTKAADEELAELLSAKLGVEDKSEVMQCLARVIEDEKAAARNEERNASVSMGTTVSAGLPPDTQLTSAGLVSLSTEKISMRILEYPDKYKTWKATIKDYEDGKYKFKDLTAKSKSLLKRSRKMVNCIDKCFGGNVKDFVEFYSTGGKLKVDTSNYKCTKNPCNCG